MKKYPLLIKVLLLSLLPLLMSGMVLAQKKVSGVVTDKESGQPMTGVTVAVKGTTTGTLTDASGKYTLNVRSETATLVASFIGYKPIEVKVGKQTAINFAMVEDAQELDAVVVTALGIKREEKALGYSVSKVTEGQLADAPSGNWLGALTGKVAGLNVTSAGGGPTASARITLRGESSLNIDNPGALMVIDGVPVENKINNTGSAFDVNDEANAGVVDYGNALGDLNADDIEDISVLKGASATALYGSRAANGAIVITTKSGRRDDGRLGVTLNSSLSFESIYNWPDFQYKYGMGATVDNNYGYKPNVDNNGSSISNSSWGPLLQGKPVYRYDSPQDEEGVRYMKLPLVAFPNNRKDFFEMGTTLSNSISVEGGNKDTKVRVSLSQKHNEWIVENNGSDLYGAQVSIDHNIMKNLKLSAKANYTNRRSDNLPASGFGGSTIAQWLLYLDPSVDVNWYKPRWITRESTSGLLSRIQNRPFIQTVDNPYVIANDMNNTTDRDGLTGTFSINWDINKQWSLMVRSGINYSNDDRTTRKPFDTQSYREGDYREQSIQAREFNSDFLLRYDNTFKKKFDVTGSFGGNIMYKDGSTYWRRVDKLIVPDVYNIQNSKFTPTISSYHNTKVINSLYGMAQFAYDKMYYLDVTGRFDVSSTLPSANNKYFYPSVSGNVQISDLLKKYWTLPRDISYLKLRLSWAQVGSDAGVYQTDNSIYEGQSFPGNFLKPTVLYNETLKPEITTNYEAGIDARFFKSRLMFDVTAYFANIKNQIVKMPIDPSTGYQYAFVNAGIIQNKGIEATITAIPIKTRDFQWKMVGNYAINRNMVKELSNGVDTYVIGSPGNLVSVEARPGQRMGDIYGLGNLIYTYDYISSIGMAYDPQYEGRLIHTSISNTVPITGGLPDISTEQKYLGNAYADWKAGLNNEFKYKDFTFSFQLDGQYGGDVYSLTYQTIMNNGKHVNTIPGRSDMILVEKGKILQTTVPDPDYDDEGYLNAYGEGTGVRSVGVALSADGKSFVPVNISGDPNSKDVVLKSSTYYVSYYKRENAENNIFDASFIKLREARLEYKCPPKLLKRTPFTNISVALWGRDLYCWSKFPGFDPEVATYQSGVMIPGAEMGVFPSTSSYGINLKLAF